ncbi:hypothetical protein STEG23_001975, partial [Scotinomys teguina]
HTVASGRFVIGTEQLRAYEIDPISSKYSKVRLCSEIVGMNIALNIGMRLIMKKEPER